jgi:hypothetical protein
MGFALLPHDASRSLRFRQDAGAQWVASNDVVPAHKARSGIEALGERVGVWQRFAIMPSVA